MHPLAGIISEAAEGSFPLEDGDVDVVEPLERGHQAVVAFTAHAVIATDRSKDDVIAHGADGFGGATSPKFLLWLGEHVGSLDVLLVGVGRGEPTPLRRVFDRNDHPRVRHARSLRDDVEVFAIDRLGLVTIGTGLAGLLEMSVELDESARGRGIGRHLISNTLDLVDEGQFVIAHVAPGNAASLRAFLACGFVPLGATVIVRRDA